MQRGTHTIVKTVVNLSGGAVLGKKSKAIIAMKGFGFRIRLVESIRATVRGIVKQRSQLTQLTNENICDWL